MFEQYKKRVDGISDKLMEASRAGDINAARALLQQHQGVLKRLGGPLDIEGILITVDYQTQTEIVKLMLEHAANNELVDLAFKGALHAGNKLLVTYIEDKYQVEIIKPFCLQVCIMMGHIELSEYFLPGVVVSGIHPAAKSKDLDLLKHFILVHHIEENTATRYYLEHESKLRGYIAELLEAKKEKSLVEANISVSQNSPKNLRKL